MDNKNVLEIPEKFKFNENLMNNLILNEYRNFQCSKNDCAINPKEYF